MRSFARSFSKLETGRCWEPHWRIRSSRFFLLQLVFGKTRALVPGIVARSPFLFSAVVFCGVFGLGVGLATANLGTMSRYRAPMMPFYVTTLLILRQRGRQTLELEERGRIRVRAGRGRLA